MITVFAACSGGIDRSPPLRDVGLPPVPAPPTEVEPQSLKSVLLPSSDPAFSTPEGCTPGQNITETKVSFLGSVFGLARNAKDPPHWDFEAKVLTRKGFTSGSIRVDRHLDEGIDGLATDSNRGDHTLSLESEGKMVRVRSTLGKKGV